MGEAAGSCKQRSGAPTVSVRSSIEALAPPPFMLMAVGRRCSLSETDASTPGGRAVLGKQARAYSTFATPPITRRVCTVARRRMDRALAGRRKLARGLPAQRFEAEAGEGEEDQQRDQAAGVRRRMPPSHTTEGCRRRA